TVQKRLASGGSWIDWRTATLTRSGTYAVSVKMFNLQNWQFRARMLGDADDLTAYSPVKELTVY
ncbi:MAG TPA: hypothetical protein VIL79_09145, partial [Thermoleophilia bacterium]